MTTNNVGPTKVSVSASPKAASKKSDSSLEAEHADLTKRIDTLSVQMAKMGEMLKEHQDKLKINMVTQSTSALGRKKASEKLQDEAEVLNAAIDKIASVYAKAETRKMELTEQAMLIGDKLGYGNKSKTSSVTKKSVKTGPVHINTTPSKKDALANFHQRDYSILMHKDIALAEKVGDLDKFVAACLSDDKVDKMLYLKTIATRIDTKFFKGLLLPDMKIKLLKAKPLREFSTRGFYEPDLNTTNLYENLFFSHTEPVVITTLAHEMAHAYAAVAWGYKITPDNAKDRADPDSASGHGAPWRKAMLLLGLDAHVHDTYSNAMYTRPDDRKAYGLDWVDFHATGAFNEHVLSFYDGLALKTGAKVLWAQQNGKLLPGVKLGNTPDNDGAVVLLSDDGHNLRTVVVKLTGGLFRLPKARPWYMPKVDLEDVCKSVGAVPVR